MFHIRIPQLSGAVYIPPPSYEDNLAEAIRTGNISRVKILIGQQPYLLNADLGEKYQYHTPMSYASSLGKPTEVETLLALGADPALSGILGTTPLGAVTDPKNNLAPMIRNKIFQTILQHAKKADIKERDPDLLNRLTQWKGPRGETLLLRAAKGGWILPVGLLLQEAPELVAWPEEESGDLPLHAAVSAGQTAIVKLLIAANPETVNETNDNEATPLYLGITTITDSNRDEITRFLLENNADPNITTITGDSPITSAVSSADPNLIKLLLRYGARTNITTESHISPVTRIIIKSKPHLLELLDGYPRPPIEDIVPPHFQMISSEINNDSDFRKMLATLTRQGYSLRTPGNTIIKVSICIKSKDLWKYYIVKELYGDQFTDHTESTPFNSDGEYKLIVLSTIPENTTESENTIYWTIDITGLIFNEDHVTNDITHFKFLFGGKSEASLALSSQICPFLAKRQNISLNNVFGFIAKEMKAEQYKNISQMMENPYFIDLILEIKTAIREGRFEISESDIENKKYALTIKILLVNGNNNELIKDFSDYYIYNACLSFMESPDSNKITNTSFYIFLEQMDISLEKIILLNKLFSKIKDKIDSNYFNNEELLKIFIEYQKLKKKVEHQISNGSIKKHGNIITTYILYSISSQLIYVANNLHDQFTIKKEFLDACDVISITINHLVDFTLVIDSYLSTNDVSLNNFILKTRSSLIEIMMEMHYRLYSILKDIPEKISDAVHSAEAALYLYKLIPKKSNSMQSHNNRRLKRNELIAYLKEVATTTQAALEAPRPSDPTVENEAIEDEIDPESPPEVIQIVSVQDLQKQVDSFREFESVERRTKQIRKTEFLQLEHAKKASKKRETPQKEKPVPRKPQWTEAEVRNAYPELEIKPNPEREPDKPAPLKFLIALDMQGKPYGSYWGYFALTPQDYANPDEYKKDLQKFNDQTSLMRRKGTYYLHDSGKGNRPHGTCYITKGGPTLVVIHRIVSHEVHMEEINNSYAPKAYLVRPAAPSAALVDRAPT